MVGDGMTPRPIHTAPIAVGPTEEPVPAFLYCPEDCHWQMRMWLRAGVYNGTWLSQGWRLASDPSGELRSTGWLLLYACESHCKAAVSIAQPVEFTRETRFVGSASVNLRDVIAPPMKESMTDHPIHGGTVLLLEDEALIAVTLQDDLEEAGYAVAGPFMTCANALEWLGDHNPDLAILDTVLKDGPCKEVAVTLTQQGVPFLVYSGHPEDWNTLSELSSATWVEKPATGEVLLQALAGLKRRASAPL